MEIMQRAFQIEQKDNVATALEELIPGALRLLGDGSYEGSRGCSEDTKRP